MAVEHGKGVEIPILHLNGSVKLLPKANEGSARAELSSRTLGNAMYIHRSLIPGSDGEGNGAAEGDIKTCERSEYVMNLQHLSYSKLPSYNDLARNDANGESQLALKRSNTITDELTSNMSMVFTIDVLFDPITFKMFCSYTKDIPNATDRLNFWSDVENLKSLPSIQYTQRMLHKIYDKFLAPTAQSPICVPTQMLQEITAAYNRDGGIQSAGIYAGAQTRCLIDLEKDVYPRFRLSKLYHKMIDMCTGPDQNAKELEEAGEFSLGTVLIEAHKLRFLKSYCMEALALENLLFYLEVEDCKRLPNQSFIANKTKKVFEKYIKEGGKNFINLAPQIHQDLTNFAMASSTETLTDSNGTSSSSGVDRLTPKMFYDAQYMVLDYIREELWSKFNQSEEYIAHTRCEAPPTYRQQDDIYLNPSDMDFMMANLDTLTSSMLIQKAMEIASEDLIGLGEFHTSGKKQKPVKKIDSLQFIITDSLARKYLKKFLAKRNLEHFIAFYEEVDEYRALPGIEFMQHTAKKIFKKYVSPNAKLQVDMSTSMRNEIEKKLSSPSIDMFKVAVARVKQGLIFLLIPFIILFILALGLLRDSLLRYLKSSVYTELNMAQENAEIHKEVKSRVKSGKLEMSHLEIFLATPRYLTNFKKFLHSQHCVENVLLWEEVEEFRRLPSYQIVCRSAKKIVDKYINTNSSKHPIPIPEHVYKNIVNSFDRADKNFFTDAVYEVFAILRSQVIPDFLDAPLFMVCN